MPLEVVGVVLRWCEWSEFLFDFVDPLKMRNQNAPTARVKELELAATVPEGRRRDTVKDLTAGSGLAYEDAGEHELKVIPALGTSIASESPRRKSS